MKKDQHRPIESGQVMGSIRHLGLTISDVITSMGRSTVRFIKNIPHQISNEFKRRINEYRRRPRRKTPNRVYSLVGYTTKAYVDSKYRMARVLRLIRTSLVLAIILVVLIMIVNSILPVLDPKNYKQIFGINDFKQLTENDPFTDHRDDDIVMFSDGESIIITSSTESDATDDSMTSTTIAGEEIE